jgi:hypothetical protein
MTEVNRDVICHLRDMARQGDSVGAMFNVLKKSLGSEAHIVTIIDYMRSAFFLTLSEAKPIAALSRTEQREVVDEAFLHELVMPEINKHRAEWD